MTLSVVLITYNEESNIARTLRSVEGLVRELGGEIIVVDCGSSDHTAEIARSFGAKVFLEEWKGFAAQKNSAIDKASGNWVLSLDADEEVSQELRIEIPRLFTGMTRWQAEGFPVGDDSESEQLRDEGTKYWGLDNGEDRGGMSGFKIPRRNLFLGRWIKHGGFWPDRKLRLFRRGAGHFEDRLVHEDVKVDGARGSVRGHLIHHSYPTLSGYIEHVNRYSSLGAQMAGDKHSRGFSIVDIVLRPLATFFYNYVFRLGFLDGREGLLFHLYHAVYVSWKYSKAWEMSRGRK